MHAKRLKAFMQDEMNLTIYIEFTQTEWVCGNGVHFLVMVIFSTIYLSSVLEVVHAYVFTTDNLFILKMPVCHQRTALFCIYKNCAKSQIDNAI